MEMEIIPFASRYEISSYGDIWDDYGKKLKQSCSREGYRSVTIHLDDGRYKNYRVNRIVLASFVDDEPFFNPTIHANHRDLVILNNHYSNLEWLSAELNNIHAALFSDTGRTVKLVADHRRGSQMCFNNIMQASDELCIHELDIWDCVKLGVSYRGWSFRHRGYSDKVPDSIRLPSIPKTPRRPVLVKDISSGIVREFSSMSEVARALDVGVSSVRSALNGDKPRLLIGKYQVVNEGDKFPVITKERIKELSDRNGKEVFVFDLKSNRVIYYPSAKEFYLGYQLSKKRVTSLLAERKVCVVDDTVFCYSDDHELRSVIMRTYGCPET
ncbi:hypothetical protein DQR70_05840 [Salmonella enterica subsp. enterica serovar Oslo]|nr:hypothetical protein [Salmonella enterica subsp. enterica serovar Oslo]